jgi:hypothetical protein
MHAVPSGKVTVSEAAMATEVPAMAPEMAAAVAATMPTAVPSTTMPATVAAASCERAGRGGERERASQDDRTRSNSA